MKRMVTSKAILAILLFSTALLFGCINAGKEPAKGKEIAAGAQIAPGEITEQPPAIEDAVAGSEAEAFDSLESEIENLENLDSSELESLLTG